MELQKRILSRQIIRHQHASVVTTNAANGSGLSCSEPTLGSEIKLIRQVGGARSGGTVNSPADESSFKLKLIMASA
jgi:hypothetical protein